MNQSIQCQCKPDDKHGETSVMCCNDCGLPTEEFWGKVPHIPKHGKHKPFIVANVREILDQYNDGLIADFGSDSGISFSRMIELFNEVSDKYYKAKFSEQKVKFNNSNPFVEFEIKWCTLENIDATATLKQHGYMKKTKKRPYSDETYEANSRLCNKRSYCSEDGEGAMEFDKIDFYNIEPSVGACKKCIKIYNGKSPIVRTKS